MLLKMVVNDFLRQKTITAAVFILVVLSALLCAMGTRIFTSLASSIESFFIDTRAPHFVQYHSGTVDADLLENYSANNEFVSAYQLMELINIEESSIHFGSAPNGRTDSVMEAAFVCQNKDFDFLLNHDNKPLELKEGEIGIPIYYKLRDNLQIGDRILVEKGDFRMSFTIVDFIRDVQMNPSLVSSKRLLIHENDFSVLRGTLGEIEYLIEFRLQDPETLVEFREQYISAGLPTKGPSIDLQLMKLLNAITDGLLAGVLIFVDFILIILALLCLRFTLLATLEEDYREIGVMKALGLQARIIRNLYLSKYLCLLGLACATGLLLAFPMSELFLSNMMIYLGKIPSGPVQMLLPLLTVSLVLLILIASCALILRHLGSISAVAALNLGYGEDGKVPKPLLILHKLRKLPVTLFLALAAVYGKFRSYLLLSSIYLVTIFIILVPMNLVSTLRDPGFIRYLGLGNSDILIDLRQTEFIQDRWMDVKEYLRRDSTVMSFSPTITCKYMVLNPEVYYESLMVETGDFSIFPIEYLSGSTPLEEDEIALSALSADALGKVVGDRLIMLRDGVEHSMTVRGLYQDLTNGGRTAKAPITPDLNTVSWYTMAVSVDAPVDAKIAEYAQAFSPAKITDINGYLDQTLGSTIHQLDRMLILSRFATFLISILITALFIRMMISKERAQIAIQKSIGFSFRAIGNQYLVRFLAVLAFGISIGTLVANHLGNKLIGLVLSVLGAPELEFIIDGLQVYLLLPATFAVLVATTVMLSLGSVRKITIADINVQ